MKDRWWAVVVFSCAVFRGALAAYASEIREVNGDELAQPTAAIVGEIRDHHRLLEYHWDRRRAKPHLHPSPRGSRVGSCKKAGECSSMPCWNSVFFLSPDGKKTAYIRSLTTLDFWEDTGNPQRIYIGGLARPRCTCQIGLSADFERLLLWEDGQLHPIVVDIANKAKPRSLGRSVSTRHRQESDGTYADLELDDRSTLTFRYADVPEPVAQEIIDRDDYLQMLPHDYHGLHHPGPTIMIGPHVVTKAIFEGTDVSFVNCDPNRWNFLWYHAPSHRLLIFGNSLGLWGWTLQGLIVDKVPETRFFFNGFFGLSCG